MTKEIQIAQKGVIGIASNVVEKPEFENHKNDFNTLKSKFYAFTSMYDENLEKQAQLYNQLLTSIKKLETALIITASIALFALAFGLYSIL